MECIKLTMKDADTLAKNFREMLEGACREIEKTERDYDAIMGMTPESVALAVSKEAPAPKDGGHEAEGAFERTVRGCLDYREICREIKEEYERCLELVTLGSKEFR